MYAVFECVAQAVKNKGIRGLCEFVPGGQYIADVLGDAYKLLRQRQRDAALRAELAKIAATSVEDAKRAAEEAARRVLGEAKASDTADDLADRITLELYLSQIPDAVRESLACPDDPTGQTVPPDLAISTPEDLARLLPSRAPSKSHSPTPLEGGATAISVLLVAPPLQVVVALRGSWHTRAANDPDAIWATGMELPGEVIAEPGNAYRLTLHPDATTDAELAKLRTLSGLPGLEAIDLSGCRHLTDAGLMHLAQLRGLKAVSLINTHVSDSALTLLLTRFPNLESIELTGAENLTETVIPHLARLRKLKHLALPPRANSADIRAEFAKRRPTCKLV